MISYAKEIMVNLTPEPEYPRSKNLHKEYLRQRNLAGIKDVLSEKTTAEQFADELTNREMDLEARADHDGLTGLLNFQGFTDALTEDLKIAQQHNISAYLVFLDIDRLKEFNDTKGKMNGNLLIQTYAGVIKQKTDSLSHLTSLVGRFGGDEFVICLIGANEKELLDLTEDIRTSIPQAIKKVFNDPSLEKTISMGITQVRPDDNAHTLLNRADQQLMQAKGKRNHIVRG